MLLSACSSAGGEPAGPPSSTATAPTSATPSSDPVTTSTAPAPIASPTASPEPIAKRRIVRPDGARLVDFKTCSGAAGGSLVGAIQAQIFRATTRAKQVQGLLVLRVLAEDSERDSVQAAKAFRAAGYPASFPVVTDLKNQAAAYQELLQMIKAKDVSGIAPFYLRLRTVEAQYAADAGAEHGSAKVCDF
ncbi:hypothetical protein [Jatrophihabitans endophyticus]|uniref:hypothetical protein n=1 Tax=Jatrophihabitans endophyticus TaxID=1206085 RepID=UPI0011612039|nr:hypothetical protein [Jatrophihabitans endophyticus]